MPSRQSSSEPTRAILPNRWQGEADCVVGPFVSRAVAERFNNNTVDFGHFDAFVERLFNRENVWYIEVSRDE